MPGGGLKALRKAEGNAGCIALDSAARPAAQRRDPVGPLLTKKDGSPAFAGDDTVCVDAVLKRTPGFIEVSASFNSPCKSSFAFLLFGPLDPLLTACLLTVGRPSQASVVLRTLAPPSPSSHLRTRPPPPG